MTITATKTLFLTSTFSPGMLLGIQEKSTEYQHVAFRVVSLDDAIQIATSDTNIVNHIGHPSTAAMASDLLGIHLPPVDPNNRVKSSFTHFDEVLVCQYIGPRLAEGEVMHNPDPNHFIFLMLFVI